MTPFLLHHLLLESAARAPAGTAVIGPGGTLDYGALEEKSGRLARFLEAQGVGKGDRVGIDLDKSLEAVIAIYAVLRAGAAYVPIDPRAPAARAAFIVRDCGMAALFTRSARIEALRALLPEMPRCAVLVDGGGEGTVEWAEAIASAGGAPADPGLIEQDLAYILYTSGSTGEPKGVMISHRASLSFVNWAVDYFALEARDRLSNHAPLHFDLSVFDLFAAAAAGAAVALVPPAASVFPRTLADWIEGNAISVWYSVPSVLIQLALHGGLDRHAFSALRLVLFAGEVFPIRHLRRLMEQLPGPAYFNLYGPTETNVCTVHPVGPVPGDEAPALPIGRACANTEVFALAEDATPARPGAVGELCVRGPTLMRGYWHRPEQTQKVLLPDPRERDSPVPVYRTGDLVRLDESGNYHFIGRRDLQVKSRGYRIELGDIEAVLYRHPGVAEAAVIALPHEEWGSTLHAVVAPRERGGVTGRDLSAFCAAWLPGYMVPSGFEFRAALPKTPNGKLDRRALLESGRAATAAGGGTIP